MLHLRSRLKIADNTGAKEIAVFSMSGKNKQRHVGLGEIVVASVKTPCRRDKSKKATRFMR